jgi:SEC-C motif domain protein
MSCPCGSGTPLETCCGRFLSRSEVPDTAEQLMRSRYTAYVMRDVDYLVDTHDPETRDAGLRESAESWARQSAFQQLRVTAVEKGGQLDPEGIVEFVATFQSGGAVQEHHERSVFRRIKGQWFYRSGARPAGDRRGAAKVGRNDPCPCGSGKKHKKCCGAA